MTKRRYALLALLILTVVMSAGCSPAWISGVQGLLPAIQTAVMAVAAFVAALNGKTVTAAFSATVQRISTDVAGGINDLKTLLADYQNGPDQTTLGKIQAVLNGILANLQSILTDTSITDTATVSKLTQLVGLAVIAAQTILGFLPAIHFTMTNRAHFSDGDLKRADKNAKASLDFAGRMLRQEYEAARTTVTDSADVNAALAALPLMP
jgi:hypothetical protein